MPFLTFPLALLALSALPTLAAIYWLRNRYRRQVVSTLSLWLHTAVAREGGRRIEKIQTPLLFLLELLALALLAFAATGPRMTATSSHVPLVVVLDDSYSMLAGGEMSPRTLALQSLESELNRGRYRVRFVLAGVQPRLLGESTTRVSEALAQVELGWRCESPAADLELAMGLAAEVGGTHARTLVLTDAAPPGGDIPPGFLQWWSFGRTRPNTAFVGASRSHDAEKPRTLFEVANLSAKPASTRLTLERIAEDGAATPLTDKTIELSAEEVKQIFIDLPPSAGVIRAKLTADDLPIDNELTLLPPPPRTVKVALDVRDEELGKLLRQSIDSLGSIEVVTAAPDLLVTDTTESIAGGPNLWALRIVRDEDAIPYVGPFVIDRFHPLSEGVSLDGVIWSAAKPEAERGSTLPGRPVITAGNIVLLADEQRMENAHELRLRIRPELSTLHRSPNWPILMFNLLEWRRGYLPGLERTNLRTGDEARLTLPSGTQSLRLVEPGGAARPIPVDTDRITLPAGSPGVYTIEADQARHRFAANVLHRGESDLVDRKAGKWGDWKQSVLLQWEHRSISWVFVVAAIALLTLHLYLIARSSGRGMRL